MAFSKDLIAASATPLILSILRQNDSYGYDIIQQVKVLSEGQLAWSEGMLYPILHRLEKKGWIQSYWGQTAQGRKRKYYQLCQLGLDQLKQSQQDWQTLNGLLVRLNQESVCSN